MDEKEIKQTQGKLYGIGLGPGDPDLVTIKAVKALEMADVIYLPKSKEKASTALHIVDKYLNGNAIIEEMEFSMSPDVETRVKSREKNAEHIRENLDSGKVTAFLTLGDPLLYSTYNYLLDYLAPEHEVETIPGIYSFAAISSQLSLPLCKGNDKLAVITSFDENTPELIESMDTVVFMKPSSYSSGLYYFLSRNPGYHFVMITNAGKADQKVFYSPEVLQEKVPYFSTIILQKAKKTNPKN